MRAKHVSNIHFHLLTDICHSYIHCGLQCSERCGFPQYFLIESVQAEQV